MGNTVKSYLSCCACCFACCAGAKIGGMSDEDLIWLRYHTPYDEKELMLIYQGFSLDFPMGGVSRRQFEKCFTTKNAQKMSDVVFGVLDADNSGFLDLKEFLLAIDLVAARTPEEKLLWAFNMYDMDNSGELDRMEMENVMKSVYKMLAVIGSAPGDANPEGRAKRLFDTIDINKDGSLSRDEFLRGCMKDDELMLLLEKLFNFLTEGMD